MLPLRFLKQAEQALVQDAPSHRQRFAQFYRMLAPPADKAVKAARGEGEFGESDILARSALGRAAPVRPAG